MTFALDLLEWCQVLLEPRRVDAHARALAAVVTKDSVVVDIGSGLGIFALLACRFGARRVYAVDQRTMIHMAREVAAANGLADRIEWIQDDPRRLTLPERADVIVCDVRQVLPEAQIPIMIDARRRLLAPGGVLLPLADRLWAAVVDAPGAHDELVGVWARHPGGMNADAAWQRSAHTWLARRFDAGELVTEPACWASIDYRTRDDDAVAGVLETSVSAAATGHGLSVWVQPEFGVGPPAAGGAPEASSRSLAAFFPWPVPVRFAVGDRVTVRFDARPTPNAGYRWRWVTTVRSIAGDVSAHFDQDTARLSESNDVESVGAGSSQARAESQRNQLKIDRHVLTAMERGATVGAIADELLAAFPARFGSRREALTHAGALSIRYG